MPAGDSESSHSSSKSSQASQEVKSLLKTATQLKKDLLNKIQENSPLTLESLKAYVNYISDTSQALMD